MPELASIHRLLPRPESDAASVATMAISPSILALRVGTPAEPDPCSATLVGHQNWVTAVTLAPAGDMLASCSMDGSARFWSLKTGAEVFAIRLPGLCMNRGGYQPRVLTPAVADSGAGGGGGGADSDPPVDVFVCGCDDGSLRAFALPSRTKLWQLDGVHVSGPPPEERQYGGGSKVRV